MKAIIFCTEMVQAIMDGRKTQTRRVIKPILCDCITDKPTILDGFAVFTHNDPGKNTEKRRLKYQPGDILWVRETWNEVFQPDGTHAHYMYKADEKEHGCFERYWRPSIHMPREAARLFLRVTDVRVERLNDISENDCCREGLKYYTGGANVVIRYAELWDNLNAKRGYSWESNPWVWGIEFEKQTSHTRQKVKL